MHSSALRSSDFNIQINGRTPSLSESFDTFRLSDRIGIVTDKPLDGLGAATLILSGVTAFYDCYREISSDFFKKKLLEKLSILNGICITLKRKMMIELTIPKNTKNRSFSSFSKNRYSNGKIIRNTISEIYKGTS